MKKVIIGCLLSAAVGGLVGFALGRKQPPSREQVVTYLSSLSLPELADLTKQLEGNWGIKAARQQGGIEMIPVK